MLVHLHLLRCAGDSTDRDMLNIVTPQSRQSSVQLSTVTYAASGALVISF